jgi:predicted short-subunit dehydrogenase-like oxidoreductase (DUF2520 family)
MRELDQPSEGLTHGTITRVAIVGHGRLGTAIAAGLTRAGVTVDGPYGRRDPIGELLGAESLGTESLGTVTGRSAPGDAPDAVLLCVPDAEIAAAALAIPDTAPVGHCSGATPLDALAPHEAFSLHPLMTVPAGASPDLLAGAGAAVAGSTPRALALARELAELLAMRPIEIADTDRAAYHAAASIASNFLVTLEAAAERVGATAGLSRELLVPLVTATVANWAQLGPERALTGPVARGDEHTVERQRAALAQRTPELLELFDACVNATRQLAAPPTAEAVAA